VDPNQTEFQSGAPAAPEVNMNPTIPTDPLDLALSAAPEADSAFTAETLIGQSQQFGIYKYIEMEVAWKRVQQARIAQKLKNGKAYKKLGYATYADFCKAQGVSYKTMDRLIGDVNRFGEQAYVALTCIGLRDSDLRLLDAARIRVDEENNIPVLMVADRRIPISADHKDEINEIVAQLVQEKKRIAGDLQETLTRLHKVEDENTTLKERVNQLENPVDASLLEFQQQIGRIQGKLLAAGMEL